MILQYFPKEYENQVWELLKLADNEFIPPLSARSSTTQNNLQQVESIIVNGPVNYFEEIKKQQIILYIEDLQVIGFMSYIPHHILNIPGAEKETTVNYVSTVIVHPEYRGKRITEKLYSELIDLSNIPIATRTWSTNQAHIHILKKTGFELIATLKDDRGENIDTVYYMRE